LHAARQAHALRIGVARPHGAADEE